MSAREESMDHLVNSLLHQGPYSTHEAKSLAEKLIDDLLHEEAEKIRRCAEKVFGAPEYHSERHAIEVGADLIDPYIR